MQGTNQQTIIEQAIDRLESMRDQQSGGRWLENLTAVVGPYIKEWDIAECWTWTEWPDREMAFPGSTNQDIGIDVVAVRRSDDRNVAIQCKSRRLENGIPVAIQKSELDSFANASSNPFWAERWLVANGEAPFSPQAEQSLSMAGVGRPIKPVNIHADLLSQSGGQDEQPCPHCQPDAPETARQTKQCMQDEAVATAVRVLQDHVQSDSGGLPAGQARGKVILPCGTGKTRISLRIVEELTPPGNVSVVLCPSIALVAQIRREYLQHATGSFNALAVCSDETAGYDPNKEEKRDTLKDPTGDGSNVSASIIKGPVTTDPRVISEWIEAAKQRQDIGVIFGTYQSAHGVAEALRSTGTTACVMIGDEAHRTAGLRKNAENAKNPNLRNFTLCHDNDAFPATYRIYQTATPKVYDQKKVQRQNDEWIVRSMDDETVFGVEIYRRSYIDAVNNGWLSDYRIIAIGVNDPESYRAANMLAKNTQSKGRQALTTDHYIRGLAFALAMGNATQQDDDAEEQVAIQSCIAFMNTVDKSKNMAKDLQSDTAREWIQKYLDDNLPGRKAAQYKLEHLDASSNVLLREQAKGNLAQATSEHPHGILNVGIFGEGTDSPSLSAVAFLEPRKSPIDVIQAVGRAMRTAPGKEMGYIICPIVIPPQADPEEWLQTSSKEDGWQELGQILLALRAHDERIEDQLSELMTLYVPPPQEVVATAVSVANQESGYIRHHYHVGPVGEAQKAAEQVVERKARPQDVGLRPLNELQERVREQSAVYEETKSAAVTLDPPEECEIQQRATLYRQPTPAPETTAINEVGAPLWSSDPQQETTEEHPEKLTQDNITATDIYTVLTTHQNADGSTETRVDRAPREKAKPDEILGPVDIKGTKDKARRMVNNGEGVRIEHTSKRKAKDPLERSNRNALQMLLLTGLNDNTKAIRMNLLTKSGLKGNNVERDLNILRDCVLEAGRHLREDGLQSTLDNHFQMDNLAEGKRNDSCNVAALLLMNAAMLHQRIAVGSWLPISNLSEIKNDANVVKRLCREWERIMRHDFRAVIEPALETVYAAENTGKIAGLEKALHHVAAAAQEIATTYAEMGTDHAGPIFNEFMGNQASDGAYFTRPVAASIAARLTLDACGDVEWNDQQVCRDHNVVDLACGSGTLLTAVLADMKRRAQEQGADELDLAQLQKLAVEETFKGLDINPMSLQLAASQLTAGNREIQYRKMGLHLMPYGPAPDDLTKVSAGTLELLGQKAIVPRDGELGLADENIGSQIVWSQHDDAELEDAVGAVKDARIIIMNPPFTNRAKMGEKFPGNIQQALRSRVDDLERILVRSDGEMDDFADKNSIGPLFVALADRCLREPEGILAMINPTIALCAPSGMDERRILAERYHIHTILTCHQPSNINMSQHTNVNESIIVMRRHKGPKSPTRFVNLDRLPADDRQVNEMHQALLKCQEGQMEDGWGVVSHWPAESIESGDWTPAIWRSPRLAKAGEEFAHDPTLQPLGSIPGCIAHDGSRRVRENFDRSTHDNEESIPILESKGAEGQKTIKSTPDGHWVFKQGRERQARHYLEWSSHLLITAGQDNSTARLTATASETKYLGQTWFPVVGLSPDEAKAVAVFTNSTPGRLQIMRGPGKKLAFPSYSPRATNNLRVPDIKDDRIRQTLADCWERTKDIVVPQFRDGECEVRRLWDEAVADAMGWDADELAHLRELLNNEPHVRGLGYNQYADEVEIEPADRERFQELADQWEIETVLLSSSDRAAEHPAHQEIISMGESAVPLILERMQLQGGHWFHALRSITNANPVQPDDRGNVGAMRAAWLHWGEDNGYV